MTSAELKNHNQPEYSVTEIAGAVKRTVEGTFSRVRVRGEISGFKRAASGHCYLDLKDDKAVLNAVCWKGQAAKLNMQPQDGLEVICTGKLTTYPGRSNYQLVIEQMEAAGIGALMALLEKLKKELAAEGLFAPERKKPLPYLPMRIGVITSPTGAVIRDILHRLTDRFPCHVMVCPVIVQGKGAEVHIAKAIDLFNSFDGTSTPPRPDILIVARGGGSIEDLWCFNEEIVVRATANSTIPLISAVGHETDTTLIDFASDRRAPTPTAAAEMAVPVLADLRYTLNDAHNRLQRTMLRHHEQQQQKLEGLARGLVNPATLLENNMQRLDEWSERLQGAANARLNGLQQLLNQRATQLSPTLILQRQNEKRQHMQFLSERLSRSLLQQLPRQQDRLNLLMKGLPSLTSLHEKLQAQQERVLQAGNALNRNMQLLQDGKVTALNNAVQMLKLLSHESVLQRGFAYVTDDKGKLVTSTKAASATMTLTFKDGDVQVHKAGGTSPQRKKKTAQPVTEQGSLL